jgi:esterase/lipase superfamily enzyme
VKALDRDGFLALVRERLAASRDYEKHAVVFVHGYNTTFDYALYRTAQIAYDLGFDGAPFVYSWPSDGAILSYPYDRESAEQAQPYLKEFLELVTKETGATSVSIIAHSMGNSLLLPVLRELKRSAPPGVAISELILAAPDVGRDSFAFLAREIRGLAKGVTLYVSAADKALLASRRFWESPRAGEVPPGGPIVAEGIETIDITALSTDLFGLNHSGFAERTPLLADIRQLIRSGARPPESREGRMQKIESADGAFWRYTP